LNILLTNINLVIPGGTESWIKVMQRGLLALGHNVDVYTTAIGPFAKNLLDPVINDVNMLKSEYDLILCNHTIPTEQIKSIKGYKINTCHGKLQVELCSPYADAYVTVSKELQEFIKTNMGIQTELIPNPVIINENVKFPEVVKRVYSLCQNNELNSRLTSLCALNNIDFSCNNKFNSDAIMDSTEKIREADVVISIGRGVYEAMAEGKGVVVLDSRDYQGLLADGCLGPENFEKSYENNCTGRSFRMIPTDEQIISWIKEAPKFSSFLYNTAKDRFAVNTVINKYFDIFNIKGILCDK
jgi:hypothetical protein